MVKIAVLGGGVNGLACAVRIKDKYKNFHVKLISSELTPNTTGDGSGGLWYPYLLGNTPFKSIEENSIIDTHVIACGGGVGRVVFLPSNMAKGMMADPCVKLVNGKWSMETLEFLLELWKSGAVPICVQPIYNLCENKENFSTPSYSNIYYGYQELNAKQLQHFSQRYSTKYVAGFTFTTVVTPPPQLLAYLQKRFEELQGEITQAKILSLQDPILKEFDVIINCTGLGARLLVPDEKMAPIRGQIARVKAPWITQVVMDDSGHYIIPNGETCILGGTGQDSYDTKVDPKDRDFIMDGCKKLIPGLEHAKVVTHWVGLRPGRDTVRLEPEVVDGKLHIHNYGHGGSGLTLFWGCSNEVLRILETYLNKNHMSHRSSKL